MKYISYLYMTQTILLIKILEHTKKDKQTNKQKNKGI